MLTKIPIEPSDAAWGTPRWTEFVTVFRAHQLDALEEIAGAVRRWQRRGASTLPPAV